MDRSIYASPQVGRIISHPGGYDSFVPAELPPKFKYDQQFAIALSRADAALSELAGLGSLLPNPHLLISPLIRREAVLSSRIEGTQASLAEVLAAEAGGAVDLAKRPDLIEVQNYVDALEYGIERLGTLPLSLRLVKELHERLMRGVRGEQAAPGEFRQSQNWIGPHGCDLITATYVPPPPERLIPLLANWEDYLRRRDVAPDLVQCAVMHEQFEAIHPFVDGNGRIGRLLITLFLIERKRMSQPLLYLSAYLESRRQSYYDLLQSVRTHGDWRSWILFFLRGVEDTARDSAERSKRLMALREEYRARAAGLSSALRLLDHLFVNPYVTASRAATLLGATHPTALKAIRYLVAADILRPLDNGPWRRRYAAGAILEALEPGAVAH